jgi:hypothetical protein
MTRIFIEGYELDLTTGLSNQITYSIDDLQNLDSKTTSFTKTIILPGTANNNKLLGNIFDFNNANFDNPLEPNVLVNFNAARNAVARIEVNGLQIMKGVLRLLEIIQLDGSVEYECAIFGELGGFINALGNSRIEDLNFIAYNHTYSYANIVASWDTSGSTGYCYPLIDYGNVSTGTYGVAKKDFQYTTFKPALFLREYITKIIANSGYTYECDFFNTTKFRNIVVPNNQKQLTKETNNALALTKVINQVMNTGGTQDFVSYPTKVGSLFTASVGDTTFTYTGTPTLTTTLTIELRGDYNLSTRPLTIALLKNGTIIPGSSETYNGSDLLYYNKTLSVQFATSDTLRVRTTCVLDGGDFVNVSESTINVLNDVATTAPIEIGDSMVINNTIPKGIFQKDFFISVLKMFNLLVTEDKNKTNHLIIEPYIDFWGGSVLDWSDKMDRSKVIKIKPMSEVNARYYNFKYKQDNDFYNEDYRKKFNEGYGDRIYDNGLEFAKDTESVEVIFASSPLFGTSTTDKVFPAIYKKSNENTKEDPMDHVVRIMQIKKVTSIASWNILNLATNLGSNTAYLYAGHLNNPTTPTDDINYGAPQQLYFNLTSGDLSNNLFNTYYSSYLAEITDKDSRLLTAYFNLTDLDIFNLDFSKFIYIDGGLYRINKVMDYAPENNELTKVDLLRVIEKEYIEQPPLPTTTTTTTSTTTTTTTLASFVGSYSMISAFDVCNVVCPSPARPVETFTIKNGGNTLCTAQTLTSPGISNGTITGIFWISDCAGKSREFVVIIEGGQFVAAFRQDACQECSAATTTTSTTTSTTTAAPATTTTTTAAPATTTTTTAAPATTTTTTAAPATTTTTTAAPATTTTTTAAPATTTTTTFQIQNFAGFQGSTLLIACSEANPLTIYYRGTLGVGNVLYSNALATTPVTTPGYYKYSNSVVYNVGLPSPQDGEITEVTSCPATTTTSTTTSAPFDYYFADEISCATCGSISADVLVKFTGGSSVTLNKYYREQGGSRVFLLNSTATSGTATTLNSTLYNTCASACPATTTTTSTSTTTSTTTLGYALVDIANNTSGTSITNITINGVQVDGATFPIVAGDGASATTTQTGGSRTIVVSYTNVGADSVEVTDTSSNITCISATGTSRTFSAQVVGDGGFLSIRMFDGSC